MNRQFVGLRKRWNGAAQGDLGDITVERNGKTRVYREVSRPSWLRANSLPPGCIKSQTTITFRLYDIKDVVAELRDRQAEAATSGGE